VQRDMFGPGTVVLAQRHGLRRANQQAPEAGQRTAGPSDERLPLRHHCGHFVGAGANDVGVPVSAVHKNPICERSLSLPPLSRVLTRAVLGRQRLQ
jgi:hypothetical protein